MVEAIIDQSIDEFQSNEASRDEKSLIFTGSGWEYFKIWIVNVVLTILTLGIYSAWAKVRRQRYFYGNTRLDNSSFDYLADPIAILKGRLLAFGLFTVFVLAGNFLPGAELVLWLIFLPFLPWVVIKALAFNARNSAYRGIRFNFEARYTEALQVFVIFPLLMVFTLGLAYPYVIYRQRRFIVGNSIYGRTPFSFGAGIMDFYKVYGTALLGLLLFSMAVGLAMYSAGMVPAQIAEYQNQTGPKELSVFGVVAAFGFTVFYLSLFAFLHVSIQNLVWNSAGISGIGFNSSLRTLPVLWLFVSNGVAIICSFGLLIPWAQIRMVRYSVEHLGVVTSSDLGQFIAGEQKRVGAAGDQVGEFFDIDLSL